MRTRGYLALALILAVVGVPEAMAGDVTTDGYPNIKISGEVDLRAVWRDDDMLDTNGGILRVGDAVTGGVGTGADWFIDPDMTVNIDINNLASPLWDARLSLKTPQWIVDDFGSQIRNVSVREAWVGVKEFIAEPVTLRAGLMDYKVDVRGDGNAFLFHPYQSESAFLRRFGNAAGNPLVIPFGKGGVIATTGFGTGTGATTAAYATGVGPGTSTGEANTLEPAGVLGNIALGDLAVDLFWFNLVEVRDIPTQDDEVAWGSVGTLSFAERGNVNALFMAFQTSNTTRIYNVGAGASVLPLLDDSGALEAYGEFVYQFGTFDRNVPALGGRSLKQSAMAFYGGLKYQLDAGNFKPGVDASFWFVGGDNKIGTRTNNDFVSYEDVDSTLIVEENNYGLDIDSNYEAIKVRFLLGWDWNDQDDIAEDLELSVLYAYFQTQEGQSNYKRKIGDEVDLQILWNYSPNLAFYFGGGWLFDTKAFEEAADSGIPGGVAGNPEGDDMMMATIGTRLTF